MKRVIKLILVVATLLLPFAVSAQNDEVTLITSGSGATKEETSQSALRSAIEQTFGTFVSSDTQILNDELVKDEIITVSSGNIKNYNEISDVIDVNQLHTVTVQATVSVNKLVSFAKAHGSSAELAGATFMMNMKMQQLNKENERKAFDNLCKQLRMIAQTNLFDYKLTLADTPVQIDNIDYGRVRLNGSLVDMTAQNADNNYRIYFRMDLYTNQNFINFFSLAYNTLNALSLKEEERKLYNSVNIPYYKYGGGQRPVTILSLENTPKWYRDDIRYNKGDRVDRVCFYFRNDLPMSSIFNIMYRSINNYSLYDDKHRLLPIKTLRSSFVLGSYLDTEINELSILLKNRDVKNYDHYLKYYHDINDDGRLISMGLLSGRRMMGLQFFKSNYIDNTVDIPSYFDSIYGYIDLNGDHLSTITNILVKERDKGDSRTEGDDIHNILKEGLSCISHDSDKRR